MTGVSWASQGESAARVQAVFNGKGDRVHGRLGRRAVRCSCAYLRACQAASGHVRAAVRPPFDMCLARRAWGGRTEQVM